MYRDLRYALRTLWTSPAFAITVVLTLGLGLGLNTALFTLFDTFVLRPFAVKDPYSLYGFRWNTAQSVRSAVSWDQYKDLEGQTNIFTGMIAYSPLLARVESRNSQGFSVSGNYFTELGVGASLGRPILPHDASVPGEGAVVMLSHQFWKGEFAGDPQIIGRTIRIGGKPFEVIGVGPVGFTGLAEVAIDFFVPITIQSAIVPGPDVFGPDKPPSVLTVGRLNPAITVEQAQAGLTVWIRHATRQLPEKERAIQATLMQRATPLTLDPDILSVMLPLVIVFGLVLVICCANVSNMMLARALGRQREIGVRLAMGASRSRLIRQLLSENLLLSLLAGAMGYGVSMGTIRSAQRVLVSTIPPSLNLVHVPPLEPDFRVFLFVFAAAAFSTVLFGLAPALQATRTSLTDALRGEFGSRVSSSRLRSALVVSQISVCLILLVLTGVLLRGSGEYQRRDPGYDVHGIVYPLFIGRPDAQASVKIAQRLQTENWVNVMAAAWHQPLRSVGSIGVNPSKGMPTIQASYNLVSPEYFNVLNIPIVRGRTFGNAEGESEAPVAVISQATARKFWPNEEAIGKTIVLDKAAASFQAEKPTPEQAVVIGIAKDVSSGPVIAGQDATMIYFPTSMHARRVMTFLIRGKGDVPATVHELEKMLAATVPDRPVVSTSMEDMLFTQIYPFRAAAWISAMLGGLALVLTLSGMYGVLSYLVGQRTKEIGIRMALGATSWGVVKLVLRQSLSFAAWGMGIGLTLAFGGSLLLRHLLTMIDAYDLAAYSGAACVVVCAALAAAFLPSNRAARINPVEALRAE